MSLADLYRNQYAWRPWKRIYPLLGEIAGKRILDVGCGIGDQAADLAARGASVVGIDADAELVEAARSRAIPKARFECVDALQFDDVAPSDGIWLGFSVAYFPRIEPALERWSRLLAPGGWIAATELDDLFGHRPLDERHYRCAENYYARSLKEGLYAFRSRDAVRAAFTARKWRHRSVAQLWFMSARKP